MHRTQRPPTKPSHQSTHERIVHLMQRERQCTLALVDHLIVMDKCRWYRDRGHSSLYAYVTNELGYSSASGWRRIAAARVTATYPWVREKLETRSVTLGALATVSRELTPKNARSVMEEITGMSIRRAREVAARLQGKSERPERIVPVAPRVPRVERMPGLLDGSPERARTRCASSPNHLHGESEPARSARFPDATESEPVRTALASDNNVGDLTTAAPGTQTYRQRYRVEFNIGNDAMQKLERVMALASNRMNGNASTEQMFYLLLECYLDKHDPVRREHKRALRAINRTNAHGGEATASPTSQNAKPRTTKPTRPSPPGSPSRAIPQPIRDKVYARDEGRCRYVDPDGKRCGETRHLHIDHIRPFARGGKHTPENLRLLCSAHNQLLAEREFGEWGAQTKW